MTDRHVCEVLSDSHDLSAFSCSEQELDDWLRKAARDSDGRRITKTYVWHRGDGVVVAYYSIMPFIIEAADMSKRQSRGLPSTIPCYLIAKLALDMSLQGKRLGSQLLASALVRAGEAAKLVGGRYIVVDAINDRGASFYSHHGFEALEERPDRLVLRVKDLEHRLGGRMLTE